MVLSYLLDIIYKTKRGRYNLNKETSKKNRKGAKEIAKMKILDYISDPNNKQLTRENIAKKVLGYKHSCALYNLFTAAELNEIEIEALEMKRTRYSAHISKIDDGVIKRAIAGDVNAAKLAYQRFENWAPSKELKLKANMKVDIDKDDAGCL